MTQENQYSVFQFERHILWYCGIYYGKEFQHNNLRYLRVMATFLLLICFNLGMVMEVIVNRDEFELIFQTTFHFIVVIVGQIRVFSLYRAMPHLNDMEEMLRDPIFNAETSTRCTFVSEAVNKLKIFKVNFWKMIAVAANIYSCMPLITGSEPIPTWYPNESFKIYCQLFEIVCMWVAAGTILSADILLVGTLYLISTQIKVLNYNLRNITVMHPDYGLHVNDKLVQDNLRICIRHHVAILEFVSKLQRIFSFGLFLEIFCSIIAICSIGVYLVTVSISPSALIIITLAAGITMLQIGMQCFAGQGLITESQQIGESCYMSEWYACNISTRKVFFIIMERSKRVISFKAGNFFELSYATFVMIIKNAYSYFTVIITTFR